MFHSVHPDFFFFLTLSCCLNTDELVDELVDGLLYVTYDLRSSVNTQHFKS